MSRDPLKAAPPGTYAGTYGDSVSTTTRKPGTRLKQLGDICGDIWFGTSGTYRGQCIDDNPKARDPLKGICPRSIYLICPRVGDISGGSRNDDPPMYRPTSETVAAT